MTLTSGSATAAAEWRRYWTLPAAAAVGCSVAVLQTYSMSPFIQPLQREFAWSRAQTSVGLTIVGIAGVAFSVPMGTLIDRWGPRNVALIGMPLVTGALALLGTATGRVDNWIALWCLVAFANLWVQPTVWTSAVASRFEKSRGLALGISLCGASLSAFVGPVLAASLIDHYGWRTAYFAIGGIWAAIGIPMMLLFFRGAHDRGRRPQPAMPVATTAPSGLSIARGLRSSAFYKLLLASALYSFTSAGVVVHFVPILTDRGAAPLAAAGIASILGLFSVLGRLGTGFMIDRIPAHLVGACVLLVPTVASALLLFDGANPVSQGIAAAGFGITLGSESDVIAYLVSRHFGLKRYGVFFGAMSGALLLGIALGPLAAGAAYDRYGGYKQFLILTIALLVASSAALASLQASPASHRPRARMLQ